MSRPDATSTPRGPANPVVDLTLFFLLELRGRLLCGRRGVHGAVAAAAPRRGATPSAPTPVDDACGVDGASIGRRRSRARTWFEQPRRGRGGVAARVHGRSGSRPRRRHDAGSTGTRWSAAWSAAGRRLPRAALFGCAYRMRRVCGGLAARRSLFGCPSFVPPLSAAVFESRYTGSSRCHGVSPIGPKDPNPSFLGGVF